MSFSIDSPEINSNVSVEMLQQMNTINSQQNILHNIIMDLDKQTSTNLQQQSQLELLQQIPQHSQFTTQIQQDLFHHHQTQTSIHHFNSSMNLTLPYW